MAFVFKTEKQTFLPQKPEIPGPGSYNCSDLSKPVHAHAPFLSTTQKVNKDKQAVLPPGPGAYNLPSAFQVTDKTHKLRYSTLSNPAQGAIEAANMSTSFKSKVKRFNDGERSLTPGPGAYYDQESHQKRRNSFTAAKPMNMNIVVQKIIHESKKGVASIPSHMNRYGYSEDEQHRLIPNRNPIFELQKYVGPGYYQAQDLMGPNLSKGISWDKSNLKRFEGPEQKKATPVWLGPGTYDREAKVPSFKNRPTAPFACKVSREPFGGKDLPKRSTSVPAKRGSHYENMSNEQSYDRIREDEEDPEILQEIDSQVPGPGFYYNESVFSSIKPKFKPPRLQFFGSSTERFPQRDNTQPSNVGPGPGEYYNKHKKRRSTSPKHKKKVPFSVSKPRFENERNAVAPGPGAYDYNQTLLDKIQYKLKSGYLGSFGTTDRRFKDNENIAITEQEMVANVEPVHKEPEEDSSKKPNSCFQSKVTREGVIVKKRDDVPPPGSYDQGYYDLSRKIQKGDGSENKPAFSVASKRFKKEPVEEKQLEEFRTTRSRSNPVTVETRSKDKMNAVFISQTKKTIDLLHKTEIPGPGQYVKAGETSWIKRTYNINYIHE